MNLVFAGTPGFAAPSLQALLAAGHRVLAVLTQPDRPSGRGRQLAASPVKQLALTHRLPIHQPLTLKHSGPLLTELGADALIVVAYGLLLPREILAIPRLGGINVHASLLPRWRGAAPIQRAIEAGDRQTGVTLMQMAAGLDTGDILSQAAIPIIATDTAASLHDKLAALGADLLTATLAQLEGGNIRPQPQDNALATYAPKLSKAEARLDWREDAAVLARRVRAFNPWPVAETRWRSQVLRLWQAQAEAVSTESPPGTVLRADAEGIRVATGKGALVIQELQTEGGKRQGAGSFLNGHAIEAGERLDSAS